jgi:hypothetical protein
VVSSKALFAHFFAKVIVLDLLSDLNLNFPILFFEAINFFDLCLLLFLIKEDIGLLVHDRLVAALGHIAIVHLDISKCTLYQVLPTLTKA